ncbi:hypothetical protein V8C86DRAFT_2510629, partial [Haematococcus lacustris]
HRHQLLQLYLLLCCCVLIRTVQMQLLDPHWHLASLCQVVDCSCHQVAVDTCVSPYMKSPQHQGLGEGVQRQVGSSGAVNRAEGVQR